MTNAPTDYDEAMDYEDMPLPDWLSDALPDDLSNASIKGGASYDPDTSIRLNGPPGAGKTTQACLRIAYLVEEKGVDPQDITVVTYRRDLAGTIEQRLKKWGVIHEDEDLRMWSTAHAVANRVHGLLAGYYEEQSGDGNLGPTVTAREKAYFCNEILDIRYYPKKPWEDTRGKLLFNVFEYAHNNLLDPADESELRRVPEYEDLWEEWPNVNVPDLYKKWKEFKNRYNWVEFYELLETALSGHLPPTRCVVIDEYHDAYPLMARVCERWISNAETAIVLADPLQVVNSYTGADPRFFSERLNDIPEILLDKSWRCPEEIWQAATRMLEMEYESPPIERDGHGGEIYEYRSPPMQYIKGHGWDVPNASIPGSPGSIVDKHIAGHDPKERDMLLLARLRKQVRGISAALDADGIIHDAQDELGGWDKQRLRVFNALIKISGVPQNYGEESHGSGLNEYLNIGDAASVSLEPEEAAALLAHTNARVMSMPASDTDEVVKKIREEDEQLSPSDIDEFVEPEFWYRYASPRAPRELTKTGAGDNWDRKLDDRDLNALNEALMRYDKPVDEEDMKQLRVLTIHASKGSEATDVAVYDGISSRIASEMRTSEAARQNEARTWYVALSRASERLHVMRDAFEWVKPHLPSNLRVAAVRRAKRISADTGQAGSGIDG